MKTGISVGDAMSQEPVAIDPNDTVVKASKLMLKKRVGSLLIIQNDELKGLITEKDIVRLIAKGLSPSKTKVSDAMTKRIHTIKPSEDLFKAIQHMKKNKVRRLPVVYRKKLVGLLTETDVLKLQPVLYEMLYDWGNIEASRKELESGEIEK
jgi:predicted transcriptional regulator